MAQPSEMQATIDALQRQVAELTQKVEALEAAHTSAASEVGAPPALEPVEPVANAATALEQPTDRRSLLRTAGAATAGAIAGAVVLGNASPAAAANGQPVTAGQTVTSTSVTTLSYTSSTAGNVFVVNDGTTPAATNNVILGAATGPARNGVYGTTNQATGIGVVGVGTGLNTIGVAAQGSRANLRLTAGGAAPPTRTDNHSLGEMIEDANGDLWVCVLAGTPGTWRKLGGPGTAGSLHLLAAPVRCYDSRAGQIPNSVQKGKLVSGDFRLIDAHVNNPNLPVGANALLINLTATGTNSGGFLAVFANGATWTGSSSLNWAQQNTTVATTTVTAVDNVGRFVIHAEAGGQVACDAIVDVLGYYW